MSSDSTPKLPSGNSYSPPLAAYQDQAQPLFDGGLPGLAAARLQGFLHRLVVDVDAGSDGRLNCAIGNSYTSVTAPFNRCLRRSCRPVPAPAQGRVQRRSFLLTISTGAAQPPAEHPALSLPKGSYPPRTKPPRSTGLAVFSRVGEVGDDDAALRKLGDDVQPSAHGLDVGPKVGDIHVRAPLQLGDRRLLDLEHVADRLLGHRPCLPQLMERHGRAEPGLAGIDARAALRREVLRQLVETMPSASFDLPFLLQRLQTNRTPTHGPIYSAHGMISRFEAGLPQ